jgi:hypothetical protein
MRVRGRCRVCKRGYDLTPGRPSLGVCERGRCRRRNPAPTRHHPHGHGHGLEVDL